MSASFLPAPASRAAGILVHEQRSGWRLLAGVLASVALGLLPDAAPASEPDPLARNLLAQAGEAARRKAALSPAQQKVDSQIRSSAWPEATPRGQATGSLAEPLGTPWRQEGRIRVIVKVFGTASAHAAALQAAGLEIEIVTDRFDMVQGWIADERVPGLAELDVVRSIRPAHPGETRIGAATSEGDAAARADLARQLGYDGTGVVVGVISDGIDSLAASQASGDLPTVAVPSDPRCRAGSGDEGTAMLEIVHDVAPAATLLFASGIATVPAMIDAIDCLTAAGARIIVDDLGFSEEPYFEDGMIAQAAADSVAAGVSYHSAAGNDQGKYYVGDYQDFGDGFHDFGVGDRANTVTLDSGGVLRCRLQWNDLFGASGNDYDLWIVDPSSGTPLVVSDNVQDGDDDPLETVTGFNSGPSSITVGLAIPKVAGADRVLKLLCGQNGPGLEHQTLDFGIYGHPAVPEVIAVGAIDALDAGLDDVEAFSSRGPAFIFFPAPIARPKPDVAAFDGVTTTAPGFGTFFGTSAAAPHSAAVAALLLSKDPTLSPAEVRNVLTSTAVDIEAAGFDDAAGFGRIDALAAINTVSAPTTTTVVTTTTLPTTTSTSTTSLPLTTTTVPTTTTQPPGTTTTTGSPTTTVPTTTSSTTTTPPPTTTTTSSTVTSTTTTTSTTQAPSTSSTTFAPTTTTAPTTSTVQATTTVPVTTSLPTTTTIQTSTTLPPTTTSTTLPACDPDDCDGNPCTVGDTCVGDVCQPGTTLTAGQLSGSVLDDTSAAAAECAGDRRKSVKKVVKLLTKAARLVGQANNAANERKARKKLAQSQRAADQAARKLGKERGGLSATCVATLEDAVAGAGTGLACLP